MTGGGPRGGRKEGGRAGSWRRWEVGKRKRRPSLWRFFPSLCGRLRQPPHLRCRIFREGERWQKKTGSTFSVHTYLRRAGGEEDVLPAPSLCVLGWGGVGGDLTLLDGGREWTQQRRWWRRRQRGGSVHRGGGVAAASACAGWRVSEGGEGRELGTCVLPLPWRAAVMNFPFFFSFFAAGVRVVG
jgi:hypothetical protein